MKQSIWRKFWQLLCFLLKQLIWFVLVSVSVYEATCWQLRAVYDQKSADHLIQLQTWPVLCVKHSCIPEFCLEKQTIPQQCTQSASGIVVAQSANHDNEKFISILLHLSQKPLLIGEESHCNLRQDLFNSSVYAPANIKKSDFWKKKFFSTPKNYLFSSRWLVKCPC